MNATSAMMQGRILAESLMLDTCTVKTTTATATNSLSGAVTVAASETTYSGRCKVQATTGSGQRTDSGEVSRVVLKLELHLPVVGSENVRRGDIVEITASANDPGLVGRTFRIRDPFHKSFPTARRFSIEEIT